MNTTRTSTAVTVTILLNTSNTPSGKLADAELHFVDGPLSGLKPPLLDRSGSVARVAVGT